MKSKILSPFPYFGGKAKMSPLICSLLDYENTSIYIEPFGGACRVLLSKVSHEQEIYNDFSYVLSGFFAVMTDVEKTEILIEMLMDNPPEKERFQQMVLHRMAVEDRLGVYTNAIISALARECYKRTKIVIFKELEKSIKKDDCKKVIERLDIIFATKEILQQLEWMEEIQFREGYSHYVKFWNEIGERIEESTKLAKKEFDNEWNSIMSDDAKDKIMSKLYDKMKKAYVEDQKEEILDLYIGDTLTNNEMGRKVSDIERAFMAFQLYYCSRDGMGTEWSTTNNKDVKRYYKAVSNLRNVAERMEKVTVIETMDAIALISYYRKSSEVMMYLDPSYLKPNDEHKNLGSVYKMSYGYKEHEELLKEITKSDTKAKILISNYDVELYNRYLCGWDKLYYETSTSVGNWKMSGNNKTSKRTEVLWKNY